MGYVNLEALSSLKDVKKTFRLGWPDTEFSFKFSSYKEAEEAYNWLVEQGGCSAHTSHQGKEHHVIFKMM